MLSKAGVDINVQDNYGWNGFHFACDNGHANVVAMLIKAGVDINIQNNNGSNGLHLAYNHFEVISTLINAGITLCSVDLQLPGVQQALDENAAQRAAVEDVMIQVAFPQRATPCEDVLDFLFLRP